MMGVICKFCGYPINTSADWIHLGMDREEFRCRACGKVTTAPPRVNENYDFPPKVVDKIAEENLKSKMKLLEIRAKILLAGGDPDLLRGAQL